MKQGCHSHPRTNQYHPIQGRVSCQSQKCQRMTRRAATSRERDMSFSFSFLIKWSQVSLRMRRSSHKSRQRRSLKKHGRSEMTLLVPFSKEQRARALQFQRNLNYPWQVRSNPIQTQVRESSQSITWESFNLKQKQFLERRVLKDSSQIKQLVL